MTTAPPQPVPYGIAPDGFRLPGTAHPGRVVLAVRDLSRSLEYYQHTLGMSLITRERGQAWLGGNGSAQPLVELREDRRVQPVSPHSRLGLYHVAILVPDRRTLGSFLAHLTFEGARVAMADHAVSEALYLWDPDGLGIEVYADRPRSTWRHHERELVMTTEPLDAESLIAFGRDTPWLGIPRGTVVGHIHLHVGHLSQAEAFYHK